MDDALDEALDGLASSGWSSQRETAIAGGGGGGQPGGHAVAAASEDASPTSGVTEKK